MPISSTRLKLKTLTQHDVDLTWSEDEDEERISEDNKGGHIDPVEPLEEEDGNNSERSSLDFTNMDEAQMDEAFKTKGGTNGPLWESDSENEHEVGGEGEEEKKEGTDDKGKKRTRTNAGDEVEDVASSDDEDIEAIAKAGRGVSSNKPKAGGVVVGNPPKTATVPVAVAAPTSTKRGGAKPAVSSKRTRTTK
jgi:hypothetical protein